MSAPKDVYASRDFIILNLGMVDLVGFDAAVLFQRIAYRCDDRAGGWAPWEATHAELSAETRLSEHRVKAALRVLRDLEWISSERADKFRPTLSWVPVWDEGEAPLVTEESSVTTRSDAPPPEAGKSSVTTYLPDVEEQLPPAEAGDGSLFAVPDITPPQTAQTLVARWVDGFRASNDGQDPPGPLMKRVAGQMGRMAKGCANDSDWGKAWQAAYAAGEAGAADAVPFLARQRSRYAKRNHDLDALQARSEGREVALSPMARATIAMIRGEQMPPALEGGTR